jgi:porin
MNVALNTPPTGVTPPIIFGAIAKVQTGDVGLTFMVFDPNDQWGKTGLERPFYNGVNLSAAVSVPMKMFGHSATHSLNLTYSTKAGTDLADNQILLPNPPTPLSKKSGSYNISYQYNQFFYENPQNPKNRWGMFFKAAIADGNPNIISYTILAGLGGSAPWRSQDSFGLGYFYYGFSGALKETFRPILTLGDEQGVEIYYKAALTPWLNLTADLQIVNPAIKTADTVYVLGFRLGVIF